MTSQYNPQILEGNLRPIRRSMTKTIPLHNAVMQIGITGGHDARYYTTSQVKLLGPSPQFPDVKLTYQLLNAKGSVYTSLTPDEMKAHGTWLVEQAERCRAAYAAADLAAAGIKESADALETSSAQLNQQLLQGAAGAAHPRSNGTGCYRCGEQGHYARDCDGSRQPDDTEELPW